MFIQLGNIPFQEIILVSSNGKTSPLKEDGSFTLTPTQRGCTILSIYRKINQDSVLLWEGSFSVKSLPAPTAMIGNGKPTMSKGEFLAQSGIQVSLVNYGISTSFLVKSYTLIITRGDSLVLLKTFEGNRFNREMKDNLKHLLQGTEQLFFTSIKIKSIFHEKKIVNSIEIKLTPKQ